MLRISSLVLMVPLLLAAFAPCRAEAGRSVFVVQSLEAGPYNAAFEGFKSILEPDVIVHRLILTDTPDRKTPEQAIEAAAADLVLAIGMQALSRVGNLVDVPVVYVMVLDANDKFSGRDHITGVRMAVSAEKQFQVLLDLLPATKVIGLLYDPARTGAITRQIRKAAGRNGVSVITRRIYRPGSVPLSIVEMRKDIDVFWMLPDLTVVTPETEEFILLLTMETETPILTFSEKYVERGALLSIGVDPFDMGAQAGQMAMEILNGADVSAMAGQYARKPVITVNAKIAERFGISMDPDTCHPVRIIK